MYGDLPYGLYVISDAVVRGSPGYIFTSEGTPIVEQNADFLRKGRFLQPRFTELRVATTEQLQVSQLISLKARSHKGFFHWVLGALPKVLIAESAGFNGSYLLPPQSCAPWAAESLMMLNIAEDRMLFEVERELSVHKLYIPTYFSGYNAHHNVDFMKLYREWIRGAVLTDERRESQRIFIARRESTTVRRVINQQDVEHVLAEYGFRTIYFEDMSFREQVATATRSEFFVAPHGAGLSHALFMDENSAVVELFPFKRQQSCDCFETLSRIPSHRYIALESEAPWEGDIEVSLVELRAVIEAELTRSQHSA
jgi:capsular polysaccharide biosynthesis protein